VFPFAGAPYAAIDLPRLFRINQKLQESSLGFANPLFQIQIRFQTVHAGCAFPVSHLGKPLALHDWLARTRVANVQTQRTPVGRKLIDIENSKPKLSNTSSSVSSEKYEKCS